MSKAPAKKDAKGKEPEVVPEVVVPKIEIGVFSFDDGSTYDGEVEIRDGIKVRHGRGTYSNGPESYVGAWANDLMNGEGQYKFASGTNILH